MPLDFHTANVYRMVRIASDRFVRIQADQIPAPRVDKDCGLPTRFFGLGGGITLPLRDEDMEARPWYVRAMLSLNNRFAPMGDTPDAWASLDEANEELRAIFGHYLPEPDADWTEPQTDDALWRWVTQGFIAQRLERMRPGEGEPEEAGGYVVRLEERMHDLEVRQPFHRYGGDAWFTSTGAPSRIVWGGAVYRPGEPDWEVAKFAFRSSCFVWATLADHVGRAHLACANGLVLPIQRQLSVEHPLRRFCKPFFYRSAGINVGASQTLLPDRALLHRATGFTLDALHEAFDRAFSDVVFMRFDDELRERGVHPDDIGEEISPFGTDGLAYWRCVDAFVDHAFEASPGLKEVLGSCRSETEAWWEDAMANCRTDLGPLSDAAVREFVKISLFNVSGYHSHVGTVGAYVRDPRFLCTKLWPGATMCDKQTTSTLCVIACITGFPMATVDGDLSQLMPDSGAAEAARAFREALATLETEITARNEQRTLPYRLFLPSRVATSVAI